MKPVYEVHAIRYATVDRTRASNFHAPPAGDPDAVMPLDFFVWLIVGDGRVVLVDTGFSAASALARNRRWTVGPVDSLQRLGLSADAVQDVVVTHLHYDHAGNLGEFPGARIWVQERELRFATGRCMCEPRLNHFFALDDVSRLLKRLYEGDVQIIDGTHVLHDGVELHRVGGHTDGLQIVRVRTAKGWVVLASDAAHYYENLETGNPFPAVFDLDDMLAGYALIRELADDEALIVPGHDPLVRERFPRVDVEGVDAYRIA